jgi:serine/threonine-protein kinase
MDDSNGVIHFGKFKIIECLKKDEHSAVYLADHVFLNKRIILKTLNTSTSKDFEKIERFKREGRILAQLDHPNIIRVLDFGTSDEYFYISFEYFDSKNLRKLFGEKKFTDSEKEFLITQILKALSYAHNNNIIHRDLKPENILVDDSLKLKISDFGLAFTSDENFITDQYSIVGTPCYMSPEQIRGERLTNKSDLFSAGIIFYELLIGRNPFLGKDVNESLNNILNYDEDLLLPEIKILNEKYQQILINLLKKNCDARSNNAEKALLILGFDNAKDEIKTVFVKEKKSILKFVLAFALIVLAAALIYFFKNQFYSEQKIYTSDNTDPLPSLPSSIEIKDSSRISFDDGDKIIETPIKETNSQLNKENVDSDLKEDYRLENKNEEAIGSLWIECIPWAEITIDKKIIQTTPLKNPVKLISGVHEIIFRHPDYPEIHRTIHIENDEAKSININLNDYLAYIICEVYPWGEIFINGKFIGQTPLDSPIKVNPGTIFLSIKNPDFKEYSEELNVKSGDSLIIHHKFN